MAAILQTYIAAANAVEPWQIFAEPATLNGASVKLAFDTGSAKNYLLPDTAERLGAILNVTPLESAHAPPCSGTARCALKLSAGPGARSNELFFVLSPLYSVPPNGEDGYIGWSFLQKTVFSIDAVARQITFLQALPKVSKDWLKLRLHSNGSVLYADSPNSKGVVLFDTGDPHGACLRSREWKAWRRVNPRAPSTVLAESYMDTEQAAVIESWAHQLAIGPLTITETPVTTWDASLDIDSNVQDVVACLGMAAMRRLKIMVDGPNGLIYIRQRITPKVAYEHNRAGVTFTSVTAIPGLWARVLPGTPAYEAGIREGDRLVKLDGVDVGDGSGLGDLNFEERSANPNVKLIVERFGIQHEIQFVLRDLLGPNVPDVSAKVADELRHVLRREPYDRH
jgi:hypothetical protein